MTWSNLSTTEFTVEAIKKAIDGLKKPIEHRQPVFVAPVWWFDNLDKNIKASDLELSLRDQEMRAARKMSDHRKKRRLLRKVGPKLKRARRSFEEYQKIRTLLCDMSRANMEFNANNNVERPMMFMRSNTMWGPDVYK